MKNNNVNYPRMVLERIDQNNEYTAGKLYVMDSAKDIIYRCDTLELPWKENDAWVSCIPKGKYHVAKWESRTHHKHFRLYDVPYRTDILIHAGNSVKDTSGCILVAQGWKEPGTLRGTSRGTLNKLIQLMPTMSVLTIK